MNRPYVQRKWIVLGLTLSLAALMAGCSTTRSSLSGSPANLSDLEGKWSWEQGLKPPAPGVIWHGEFVLEKDGTSYTGTLDDVSEGTYNDTIEDVTLSGDQIAFTRDGTYGVQQWKGTLAQADGVLKIIDGTWTKEGGLTGTWSAEKMK